MISSSKITAFMTLYLFVLALLPGVVLNEFQYVPESARAGTLLACALYLIGIHFGAALVKLGRPAYAREPSGDNSDTGLAVLGLALLGITAYVIAFGPVSPIIAAATGHDVIEVALQREEAIKLNPDTFFVRVYANTRDILAPAVFALALDSLFHSPGRLVKRLFLLLLVLTAMFIGVWSGQKATLINYFVASMIFLTRNAATLMRSMLISAPLLVAAIYGIFLVTYSGSFDEAEQFGDAAGNVFDGMIHRLFVGPFEVSMAYVDAADNQNLIDPITSIPVIGAILRPSPATLENVIGMHYFYTGIDSISANALCFAYAYILGGYAFCFVMGVLTIVGLTLATKIVRTAGNAFIDRAFQAMVAYRMLDLLNGNPLSYLFGLFEWAVLAWMLARFVAGVAQIRAPFAAGPSR
jgi:hypothetical protein